MKHASFGSSLAIVLSVAAIGGLSLTLLSSYWIFLLTAVFVVGIALQSLGIVAGRTGMISLCQMSFAGVGAWTTGYLNVAGFPGGLPVWILIGGLAAVPVGVAIGLPALRLRGINLAIVTLGFAAAFDTVLATITFPGQTSFNQVARPALFDSDEGYFLFVLVVYAVIAVALEVVSRTRLGAAWLAVRHSERAAAAVGVSVPGAKLSAFAISAFIAGISGGLLAGYLGTLVSDNFSMMQSLALFAVATMTGAHYVHGSIAGGVLIALFPELMRRLNLPQDLGAVVFALGAVQALSTGESMAEALMRLFRRLFPRAVEAPPLLDEASLPKPAVAETSASALDVSSLTVRYGSVIALDKVDITIPQRTVVGLVGPNGAGKSTLVDAVAGFLPTYEGSARLAGAPLDGLSPRRRARRGLRRTWQTTRIAPELDVGQYVQLASGGVSAHELDALLAWLECPAASTPIAFVDAGTRRLLDIAGAIAARPQVLLLDEPAAGQSYAEAVKLGQRIAEIPSLFGSAVLLIEHDMDIVRQACSTVTVLDFGRVIASGPPQEVLDLPAVRKAYMGVDGEAEAAA
ncbi:MAG: ATP-binding cassette domain-containing protein [Rhizobiaceae bacterium]|nr:ATP-binding cassette domain-containing protein [Rhizobiaceae bacterium]MCV0408377.1 ATP-binding cassette domain-containing protein [Rhizobiaceae bacterium]